MDYIPKKGFAELNEFFEGFSMCWNSLIKHTMEFLAEFHDESSIVLDSMDMHTFYPESLKKAVHTMRKVINATGSLPGDSRANIIELQLAYSLRRLEMDMQPGAGVGHGLISILEISK
jgi:hypothetical protein